MIHSERIKRSAYFVNSDGTANKLNRIPLMNGSFNEAWLQQLIEQNPSILPTSDVGLEFSPVICIGREVPVGSSDSLGYIDNLYISATGRIVIVETKLFRNQEARRAVVSQIIDYAKEVAKWDIDKLDQVAGAYYYSREGQSFRIIDLLVRYGFASFEDESAITDTINRNLKSASFLLMIVGDGIRTGVEQLADFLNDNSNMPFNLALVEVEVYQHNDGVTVIPNLLTKTDIVDRKIITITGGTVDFDVSSVEFSPTSSVSKPPILSIREYIYKFSNLGGYDSDQVTEFVFELGSINGITMKTTPTELQFRFSIDGGNSYSLMSLSIWNERADLYIMPEHLKAFLEKHGHFPSEADNFLSFFKEYVDISRCKLPPYEYSGCYYALVADVLCHEDDFMSAVEEFIRSVSEEV